jgi:hypothetical protein
MNGSGMCVQTHLAHRGLAAAVWELDLGANTGLSFGAMPHRSGFRAQRAVKPLDGAASLRLSFFAPSTYP